MDMKRLLKGALGSIWLILIAIFYFKNHSYYQWDLPGIRRFWPIIVLPLLIYLGLALWNWTKDQKALQLKLKAWHLGLLFLLGMLLIGNVTFATIKPIVYVGEPVALMQDGSSVFNPDTNQISQARYYIRSYDAYQDTTGFYDSAPASIKSNLVRANFWQIQTGLLKTILKVYGLTSLLLFISWVLGSQVRSFIQKKEEDFSDQLINLVLGLGLLSSILLIIAILGFFNWKIITLALLGLSGLCWKKLSWAFKHLWKWEKEFEFSASSSNFALGLFIFTFLGLHIFDNLSVIPRGWDGLNRYMNIAKDLSEQGEFLYRGGFYAWELILGYLYNFDIQLALAWTGLPGLLNFLVMWALAKRYVKSNWAALALAAIVAMPMMAFHISDENKVDLAHWLFGSTSILAFVKALDEDHKKILDTKYLYLAALFAGFALTIKFTGVLLMVSLLCAFAYLSGGFLALFASLCFSLTLLATQGGLSLGYQFLLSDEHLFYTELALVALGIVFLALAFIKKKLNKKDVLSLTFISLFMLLPLLPWAGIHSAGLEDFSYQKIFTGPLVSPQVQYEKSLNCENTGFIEEYDRYIGYNNNIALQAIAVPWHITMNDTGAIGGYVDIGFLFLGLALFMILLVSKKDTRPALMVLGLCYGLFWLLKANGVSWYGFPLFTLIFLAQAITYEKLSKDNWLKWIAILFSILWLVMALDTRLSNFGKSTLMLQHAGVITEDQVRESIFPNSDSVQAVLAENEGLVYKVGTPMGYFIPNFFERSYDDQLLDTFNCLHQNTQDFDTARNILLDLGFRYVIYDGHTNTVGLDPNGTLNQKVTLFQQFIQEQLWVAVYDDVRQHHLLYIPSDEELAAQNSETI